VKARDGDMHKVAGILILLGLLAIPAQSQDRDNSIPLNQEISNIELDATFAGFSKLKVNTDSKIILWDEARLTTLMKRDKKRTRIELKY